MRACFTLPHLILWLLHSFNMTDNQALAGGQKRYATPTTNQTHAPLTESSFLPNYVPYATGQLETSNGNFPYKKARLSPFSPPSLDDPQCTNRRLSFDEVPGRFFDSQSTLQACPSSASARERYDSSPNKPCIDNFPIINKIANTAVNSHSIQLCTVANPYKCVLERQRRLILEQKELAEQKKKQDQFYERQRLLNEEALRLNNYILHNPYRCVMDQHHRILPCYENNVSSMSENVTLQNITCTESTVASLTNFIPNPYKSRSLQQKVPQESQRLFEEEAFRAPKTLVRINDNSNIASKDHIISSRRSDTASFNTEPVLHFTQDVLSFPSHSPPATTDCIWPTTLSNANSVVDIKDQLNTSTALKHSTVTPSPRLWQEMATQESSIASDDDSVTAGLVIDTLNIDSITDDLLDVFNSHDSSDSSVSSPTAAELLSNVNFDSQPTLTHVATISCSHIDYSGTVSELSPSTSCKAKHVWLPAASRQFLSVGAATNFARDYNDFNYARKYSSKGTITFVCTDHVNCTSHVRVVPFETNGVFTYCVDACQSCFHADTRSDITDLKSLPVVIKRLVDNQLSCGNTPTPIYLLMLRCALDNNLLDVHKTLNDQGRAYWQLKLSNKKHQSRKKGTNWDTYASIMENLQVFPTPSIEKFNNLADPSLTLFLGHFSSDPTPDEVATIGFVFSNKLMIENAVRASISQGTDLTAMIDGTYKVSSRGWVLANLGVLCGYYNAITRKYQKSFMLVAVCFMKSETIHAYSEFCSTFSASVFNYKNVNFVPRYVIMDHSNAIAGGVERAWHQPVILTCWPHLCRNVRKNFSFLVNKSDQRKKLIQSHILFLHYLPTPFAFSKLAPIVVDYWKNTLHESAFANWFYKIYLECNRWDGWYLGASGCPGVLGNNNALESAQRVQKNTETIGTKGATNEHVFTLTIPNVLKHCKVQENAFVVSGGPLPGDIASTASIIYNRSIDAVRLVHEGFVVCALSSHSIRGSITDNQLIAYLKIVRDNNFKPTFSTVKKLVQSVEPGFSSYSQMKSPLGMHMVTYNESCLSKLELKPFYTQEEVQHHRSCMSCDCETFHETAWICEHTLAARYRLYVQNNDDGYDLNQAGSTLRENNKPGRKAKSVSCLQNKNKRDEEYQLKVIHNDPRRATGLAIQKVEVHKGKTVSLSGKVGSVCPKCGQQGKQLWRIAFDNGTSNFWTLETIWRNCFK